MGEKGSSDHITRLLNAWRAGDLQARESLFDAVYAVLRDMAVSRLGGDRQDVTLRPTSLVHEALLRMLGRDVSYTDRAHFFALVALKMRAVLVDYARASLAAKRGGGASTSPCPTWTPAVCTARTSATTTCWPCTRRWSA